MRVKIIKKSGSHLLVARRNQFAVVEKRNHRFYNCHGRDRAAVSQLSAVDRILDTSDWMDPVTARATFHDITTQGRHLAETMR